MRKLFVLLLVLALMVFTVSAIVVEVSVGSSGAAAQFMFLAAIPGFGLLFMGGLGIIGRPLLFMMRTGRFFIITAITCTTWAIATVSTFAINNDDTTDLRCYRCGTLAVDPRYGTRRRRLGLLPRLVSGLWQSLVYQMTTRRSSTATTDYGDTQLGQSELA